jgi:hypothetical protein
MKARRPPLRPGTVSLALAVLALGAGIAPAAGRGGSNPIAEAFPLVFDAEWIRLDIAGDSLEVSGTFLLLCRAPIEEPTPLFFPFPRDSLLGGARMVSLAYRTGAGPPVPAGWEEIPSVSGVRWWIPPCRGDSVAAEVVYRQKIVPGYARYIVTTARVWGRPIRYASFEIRLPPGAEPLDFSYPFECREADGETFWVYETRDFSPDRDIVVRWRP